MPDPTKSIEEGAIAPWNTPAYEHELEELLALAPDYGIRGRRAVSRLERSRAATDRRGSAASEISAGCAASSPGSNGANTRCTCGSS